jgi:hypothetical protein
MHYVYMAAVKYWTPLRLCEHAIGYKVLAALKLSLETSLGAVLAVASRSNKSHPS